MDNFKQIKPVWQTPEIIDLDINDTLSGDFGPSELDTSGAPVS